MFHSKKIYGRTLFLSIISLVGLLLMGGFHQSREDSDEKISEQLQSVLETAITNQGTTFPGALLYASSPDGVWTNAAGLGDISAATVMKPDNKFRAGSIMKTFVAVVTLQLVEEERFSLNDTLPTVLPEHITRKFIHSNEITVRMLLNHTSGIAEFLSDAIIVDIATNPTKIWNDEEWLDLSATQGADFAPGEGWNYSNTNYILLGIVIEQATGLSWREEIRQRIINRLNLSDTFLPDPGDLFIPGNHARGYVMMDELLDFTGVDPSMAGASGGGALVTTASDLARFLEAVLAGQLFQTSGTLHDMLTFVEAHNESGLPYYYGLGMEKYVLPGGSEMVGHAGDTAGFASFVHVLPDENITIAAAVNTKEVMNLYIQIFFPSLEVLNGATRSNGLKAKLLPGKLPTLHR